MKTLLIFLILVFTVSVFGQVTSPRPAGTIRANITGTSDGRQWEYLIVSFGKVYFSDPIGDADVKTTGLSKLISFSNAGIVIAKEAVVTENKIDILGKFGWELMGIVGAVGGDQEMLFKRPYLPERSKQEEALIKEEGEMAKAAIEEERRRALQAAPDSTLVDMDQFERIKARNVKRLNEEERLKKAVDIVKGYSILINSLYSNATSAADSNVSLDLTVDGTKQLLSDGNKYRSSEAENLAKEVALVIFKAAQLTQHSGSPSDTDILNYYYGSVRISVSISINFRGQSKTVAVKTVRGDWSTPTLDLILH